MNFKKTTRTVHSFRTLLPTKPQTIIPPSTDALTIGPEQHHTHTTLSQDHQATKQTQKHKLSPEKKHPLNNKTKFICKANVLKQRKEIKKEDQQKLLYKYFRRKIFSQVSLQNRKTEREMIKIYDWLMQASKTLYLTRDAFYSAINLARKVMQRSFLWNASQKVLESFVAGILSLAAKFENGSVNYPEAIHKITDQRINKLQIIEAEILIIKKVQFKVPSVHMIFETVVNICRKWHDFVIMKGETLRMEAAELLFGEELRMEEWKKEAQQKLSQVCYLFDVIMLYCQEYQIDVRKITRPCTLALFTLMNARTREFFPLRSTDKTYLILIFHQFLSAQFGFSPSDVHTWMHELVRLRHHLKIVENSQHICTQNISIIAHDPCKNLAFHFQPYLTIHGWR